MTYNNEYITTKLRETLGKMTILPLGRLRNSAAILTGIIISKSVISSDIASELKDDFSEGKESSKIKRIYRFFSNEKLNPETNYHHFIKNLFKNYKPDNNKVILIIDHTTIEDKFLVLQISMKIGKRAIPLWFKIFKYNDENNKNFNHIKAGLNEVNSIISLYNFDVLVLADRGFKSVDLFEFISNDLRWKYCIRCTKDVGVEIPNEKKIEKLQNIKPVKNRVKHYTNVKLTAKKYTCDLAVCKHEDKQDVWYLIHNIDKNNCVNEYKKRFEIEEMFRDLKSNGFNLEDTWSKNLVYIRNLYFCLCIAYTWMIILGVYCRKNKKNSLLGVTKKIKNKTVRIYSLFKCGIKWFKRCLNSQLQKYYLCFNFILHEK
ncbi:UNVERIFIED_CONTAM: DDE family transposase [Acetivibrio alkalicellulosi]